MRIKCGVTSGIVDASLSFFADDMAQLWHSSRSLDGHLAEGGYKQNMSKNEIVSSMRNGAANRGSAKAELLGRRQVAARYLGGRQTWNNSMRVETQYRLRAKTSNWMFLNRYWTSGAPRRQKRLMFVVRVQTAALTGVDSLPLARRETLVLVGKMGKWLRAMVTGGAVSRGEEGEATDHDVAMNTKQVMACWCHPAFGFGGTTHAFEHALAHV